MGLMLWPSGPWQAAQTAALAGGALEEGGEGVDVGG
jgi:hypothetical protein